MRNRLYSVAAGLTALLACFAVRAADPSPQQAEMAGYLLVPHEKIDKQYNGGFSTYVAA